MKDRKRVFSAIIKLFVLVGLLLLSVVFVNSLFTRDSKKSLEVKKESPIVSIDISDMFKGQIRKIRWDKKEVAILLRQFPKKLTSISTLTSKNELHPVLNKATRSINREYFVYLNTGDSNNCPLYYSGGEFKDVCSSNKFDESGRMLTGSSLGFQLMIPPHYFIKNQLIIGKWEP